MRYANLFIGIGFLIGSFSWYFAATFGGRYAALNVSMALMYLGISVSNIALYFCQRKA